MTKLPADFGFGTGFGAGFGTGFGTGLATCLLTGTTYRRTGGVADGHVGHGGAASISHDNTISCMGTLHRSNCWDMRTD